MSASGVAFLRADWRTFSATAFVGASPRLCVTAVAYASAAWPQSAIDCTTKQKKKPQTVLSNNARRRLFVSNDVTHR
jgi:hypothetical protein